MLRDVMVLGIWLTVSSPIYRWLSYRYNLEALLLIKESSGTHEFDRHIKVGIKYYLDNFFTEEGIAKYYNDNLYPIDMHSFSQAIITLIKVGGRKSDFDMCKKN